jgi:twitching motility protein PilT
MYSQMQVGQNKFGMQTMSQALVALVQQNLITPEVAIGRATEPEEVRQMLGLPRGSSIQQQRPAAGSR